MHKLTRLSLAALLSLSPLALVAQAHDAHPAPAAEKHEAPAAGHAVQPTGHEAQAGGEHAVPASAHGAEAHGGAHHKPPMVLFGKEYGNGGAFLVQLLNFAIYGAGLFFILKGALSAMFKSRKEELETMLAQAERDKAEGEAQMKDMEAKMAGLEGVANESSRALMDLSVQESLAIGNGILTTENEEQAWVRARRAEGDKGVRIAQAQAEIGYQKRQAEQELRALVAELAVEGAAKRLEAKLQGPEAAKAVDRAIQQIGGAQ